MMKYKIFCTYNVWLPKEDGGIKLKQEDEEERPLWPQGEPVPINVQPMRNIDEIVKDISRFIKCWGKLSEEDSTGEYRRRYEYLCYY